MSGFSVEELGIKELSPAYLDVNLKPEDLLTGVNFASGAAGYDPLTSELSVKIFKFQISILEIRNNSNFYEICRLFYHYQSN